MLMSKQDEFSSGQAVTSTAISTNVIDLLPGGDNSLTDLGNGCCTELVIQCTEAAAAVGEATVTFSLESDSTADLATSATVHFSTAAIGKASLTAGTEVARFKLPAGSYERYLGVRYTVATGPLTAGKFNAFLTPNAQAARHYNDAITIS